MIIKLQLSYGNANYIIFDNCTEVTYSVGKEEKQPLSENNLELDQFYYNGGNVLNRISCLIDGEEKNLWFDGEAFICNGDGKTIQRIQPVEKEFQNFIGSAKCA